MEPHDPRAQICLHCMMMMMLLCSRWSFGFVAFRFDAGAVMQAAVTHSPTPSRQFNNRARIACESNIKLPSEPRMRVRACAFVRLVRAFGPHTLDAHALALTHACVAGRRRKQMHRSHTMHEYACTNVRTTHTFLRPYGLARSFNELPHTLSASSPTSSSPSSPRRRLAPNGIVFDAQRRDRCVRLFVHSRLMRAQTHTHRKLHASQTDTRTRNVDASLLASARRRAAPR